MTYWTICPKISQSDNMPDYKEMYIQLYNKITDVIEELQQIQRKTEELYIKTGEPKLVLMKSEQDKEQAHSFR